MYSANGRVKPDKETANKKSDTLIVFCNDCGAKEVNRKKVFGEIARCCTCGSTDIIFLDE